MSVGDLVVGLAEVRPDGAFVFETPAVIALDEDCRVEVRHLFDGVASRAGRLEIEPTAPTTWDVTLLRRAVNAVQSVRYDALLDINGDNRLDLLDIELIAQRIARGR